MKYPDLNVIQVLIACQLWLSVRNKKVFLLAVSVSTIFRIIFSVVHPWPISCQTSLLTLWTVKDVVPVMLAVSLELSPAVEISFIVKGRVAQCQNCHITHQGCSESLPVKTHLVFLIKEQPQSQSTSSGQLFLFSFVTNQVDLLLHNV